MEIKVDKAFDFEYLLLEYYKTLHLSEEELAVIMMINHLLEQKNYILTGELVALKMTLSSEKIDSYLARFLEMKIIDLNNSEARLSLQPLKKKLIDIFMRDFYIQNEEKNQESMQNIYSKLEEEMSCTLKPTEVSRIRDWFAQGYKEEDIINAIKDLKSKAKRITISKIDSRLLQKVKSEEIKQEGRTTITDTYTRNLEDTIALTKMKWLEDDE